MKTPSKQSPAGQARLPLQRVPDFDRGSLIVSNSNAAAFAAIEKWPDWPDGRLVLVGPPQSGKSHLAAIWAKAAGATLVRHTEAPPLDRHSAIALEDMDRRPRDEAMFHLLNDTGPGATLLMTARTPPREWTCGLRDLRSRLNALWVVELSTPDDTVLFGLMTKFFRERNIRPDLDVIPYLLRRIERSAAAAYDIVARIDEAADVERRGVTRAFVRDVLDRAEAGHDLFD